MKKTVLFTLVLFALSTSVSFAAAKWYSDQVDFTGGTIVQLSTNVNLGYDVSTGQDGYSAGTFHSRGTRTFASSSGDSQIFYQEGTSSVDPEAAPVGTASAGFAEANWTAL